MKSTRIIQVTKLDDWNNTAVKALFNNSIQTFWVDDAMASHFKVGATAFLVPEEQTDAQKALGKSPVYHILPSAWVEEVKDELSITISLRNYPRSIDRG